MIKNKIKHLLGFSVSAVVFAGATLTGTAMLSEAHAGVLDERAGDYQWRLCPAGRLIPIRPGYTDDSTDPGATEIRADSSRLIKDGVSQFNGDVQVVRGAKSIAAEVVTYDDTSGLFTAEGRTHIWDKGLIWSGESATYDLNSEVSRLSDGRYWLMSGRGRGYASSLVNDQPAQKTVLDDVVYSTCPLSQETWRVSAKRIKLDHESDRGSATHAVLRIRDVPVFYFPYVNFPISDKRKSGFLAPAIGTTNESGFDFRLPYYWNIAPNHDATFTPRYLSDRGLMLAGEYRYLGRSFDGELHAEYLPGDDRKSQDRSLFSFEHTHFLFRNRGRLYALYNNVSDDEYFEDFGRSISVTSQRFLDRRLDFDYRSRRTFVDAVVQSYQTIDDSIRPGSGPYRTLPKIRLQHVFPSFRRFQPIIRAETSYFDRDASVTGARLYAEPSLSYLFVRPYLEITPKVGLHHTQYFLDDPNNTFDDTESRTAPVISLDTKLFLERRFNLFGTNQLQTFEPRLYYLLIPNIDQNNLPRFDTGLLDVSFRNIFRDNRFSGLDRLGDANQITAAFTSRLLDTENGGETFRLSVGQIYYFRDRVVQLPRRTVIDDSVSELVAEAAANLFSDWSIRGAVQWDPNEPRTEKSSVALRYRPNLDTVVNLSYRFRRAVTDIEQTDVSLRVPLFDRFALIGRWNFSLPERQTLEAVGGIEYESCCWGLRVVARRFLRNSEGEFDSGLFAQVHFRGLGGFGRKSGSFLRRAIPGYDDPFD